MSETIYHHKFKNQDFKLSPNCPYCGDYVKLTSSKEFYGKDFKTNVYYCQSCRASTTTHGNTDIPKGRLANKRLKDLRKLAHSIFDPMWVNKTHFKSRWKAMEWLGSFTCGHFAWMDVNEICMAIEAINAKRKSE